MNYSAITGPRRCDADARGWHFMVATSGNIHDLCADPSKSQGLGGGPAMARRPAGFIPRRGALRHNHFWPNAIALSPSKIRAFRLLPRIKTALTDLGQQRFARLPSSAQPHLSFALFNRLCSL